MWVNSMQDIFAGHPMSVQFVVKHSHWKKELKNHINSIHDGIRCSVCFKSFVKKGQF